MSIARDIYTKAVSTWGIPFQVNTAIEECSKLITTVRRYDRGKATREEVCSEIAGVEIMMGHLRIIFGDNNVDKEKLSKILWIRKLLKRNGGESISNTQSCPVKNECNLKNFVCTGIRCPWRPQAKEEK